MDFPVDRWSSVVSRMREVADAFRLPDVPRRYVTVRKIVNFWRCQFAWLLASDRVGGRPYELVLEMTNACNLRCPHCPTGRGRFGRRPTLMDMAQLERVVDELAPYAFTADLHNWGEPMLHGKLTDAIRLLEEKGVRTTVCTNFNVPFDAAKAEALVRSGLSVLGVSIDGPDQATYETYRVRGRLTQVLKNASLVVAAKRRLGSDTPRVIWTYLLFRHNERRLGDARRLATRLGFDFEVTRGLVPDDPTWETTKPVHHPAFDLFGKGRSCRFLYSMAAVNADLGVSPCCSDAAFESVDDFGTVRDGSFRAVWNGTRHRAARRLFRALDRRGTAGNERVCCERCSIYTLRRDAALRSGRPRAGGRSSTQSTSP